MESGFDSYIDVGAVITCSKGKRGVVEDVLNNGWFRIKLLPDIAKWEVVHISQVVNVERKED